MERVDAPGIDNIQPDANRELILERVFAGYKRRRPVLRGVSLKANTGITGLLGPNGAGKTTLFETVVGSLKVTSGSINLVSPQYERGLGYLPQTFDTVGSLSVIENVEYAAWVSGVPENYCRTQSSRALEIVDLSDKVNEKSRRLSGGQRQRMGLACAIVHDPSILLLDEPTVGLDPLQRSRFRGYLSSVASSTIILVSTHLVEDLWNLSGNVIVMNNGRVKFTGSVKDLADIGAGSSDHISPLEDGYRAVIENDDE